jgi:hypothetical protein
MEVKVIVQDVVIRSFYFTLITLLIWLLMLISCAAPAMPDQAKPDLWTSRIIDEEAGVICWVYKAGYAGGISCLPLEQTRLGE